MNRTSEYTLVFRVESEAFRSESLGEIARAPGECMHIERKGTRTRDADSFDRWEIPAENSFSSVFESIGTAFTSIEKTFAENERRITTIAKDYDAYWWCGCFHSASPSLTFLPRSALSFLGMIGARLILDTYYSPNKENSRDVSEGGEVTDFVASQSANQSDRSIGHSYRFRLLHEAPVMESLCRYSDEEGWSEVYEDFSFGLDSFLSYSLGDGRDGGGDRTWATSILCEHVQSAFDGGPRITADQCDVVAANGLSLAVLWRAE